MQKENDINLKNEVTKRYEQLHPDLKAALVSVDTASIVYEIGKRFGLNIEKTGYLADVIGYTVIGLLPVSDFVKNLKDTLEIDGAKAEEIAREVNSKIFFAIREQLKKTHGEKWDERALREPTTNNLQPITTTPTKPTTETPTVPMVPKSPWEIRPDEIRQEIGDKRQDAWQKSVIPPLSKPTTDNLQPTTKAMEAEMKQATSDKRQETTPPELPKTREAPQPTPAPQNVGVLKEIRPTGQETGNKKQETGDIMPKPVLRVETAKTVPPENLPFAQEVKKLTQIPELEKPQQPPAEASIMKQVVRDETKQPPTKITEKHYEADPYREPIE